MRRVLIVDDSDALSRSLKRILEDAFAVDTSSPNNAIERIQHQRFDVVITDVLMPGLSGVQLYRWIRSNQSDLAARVVFMTGLDHRATMRLLCGLPNPILEKPFPADELVRAIQLVLATRP